MTFCSDFDVVYLGESSGNSLDYEMASFKSTSLCGSEVSSQFFDRTATVGGIVAVDRKYYGLTVAHVCIGDAFPPETDLTTGRVEFYDEDDEVFCDDDDEKYDSPVESPGRIVGRASIPSTARPTPPRRTKEEKYYELMPAPPPPAPLGLVSSTLLRLRRERRERSSVSYNLDQDDVRYQLETATSGRPRRQSYYRQSTSIKSSGGYEDKIREASMPQKDGDDVIQVTPYITIAEGETLQVELPMGGIVLVNTSGQLRPARVEWVSSSHPLKEAKAELFDACDWALLEIDKPLVSVNEISFHKNSKPEFLFLSSPKKPISSNTKLLVIIRRGYLKGFSSGSTTSLNFGTSQTYQNFETIQLDENLEFGDSGSWVIDAETGSLYGIIIARSSFLMEEQVALPSLDQSLAIAAENGTLDLVQRLVKLGARIEAVDWQGNTALEIACGKGRKDIVLELLDHWNKYDPGPITSAATFGQLEIVNILLAIEPPLSSCYKALEKASEGRHVAVVKRLLGQLQSSNAGPLHAGVEPIQRANTISDLPPSFPIHKYSSGYYLFSLSRALDKASARGHQDIVQLLLETLDDPDADLEGSLIVASRYGRDQVVKQLLSASSRTHPVIELDLALRLTYSAIIRIDKGNFSGNKAVIQLLENVRGQLNGRHFSFSAVLERLLHSSPDRSAVEIITYLRELGADMDISCSRTESTILHKVFGYDPTLARLMMEKRADSWCESLHKGVEISDNTFVKFLISQGVDVNLPRDGRTILDTAIKKQNFSMVKYLSEHNAVTLKTSPDLEEIVRQMAAFWTEKGSSSSSSARSSSLLQHQSSTTVQNQTIKQKTYQPLRRPYDSGALPTKKGN
ncbi:hypothetical protein B7463_g10398, partial [Scytalidium lignicola]